MGLPTNDWTAAFLGMEEAARGTVVSAGDGLVSISVDGVEVVVSGDASVGEHAVLAVRPEDVLLFEASIELPVTTARNRLRASVVAVTPQGASNHVVLDAHGLRLAARVSRAATTELGLIPGASVLALFKATAVRWAVLPD